MAQTAERVARTPRRAEMVAVAARLFSARGYHGTSMQHLGEALGLQRGSLYSHIGSKEELLFDVVDDGADHFLERGRHAIAAHATAADKLRALLVAHIQTATEHLHAATVFLNEWRYLSNDLRATVQDKRDRYEAMVREAISEGIDRGEFDRGVDATMAARLVLSAGNWVYTWYQPGGDLSPAQIADAYWSLIVEGLKNREES